VTVTESGTAAPAELHPVAAPIASCGRLSHITDCWKVRPARVRARQVRRRAEPVREPCRPKLLVPVVDADAGRVLAQVVDHVAVRKRVSLQRDRHGKELSEMIVP
jgi:hypothetical protein